MFQSILIAAALGYFIGCFQSAYLLIRWIKKQDIREHGFGNAGASNTVSSFGWRLGIVVALLDILKPILSIVLLKQMIAWGWVNDYPFLVMLNGFFVILGHNYPFYLNFKGGKGTASLIGLMIAIHPLYSLFGLILFVISALVSNYIVMGTVALLIYFIGISLYLKMGTVAVLFAILIAAQSLYLHWPNFKRIANKTETKITSKLKK